MTGPFDLAHGFGLERPIVPGAALAAIAAAAIRSELAAPEWLLPAQVDPFRRAAAAVRQYGGVLLGLPVGSGKTYVALAVATAIRSDPPVAVVPAVLVPQWREVARSLGIELGIVSHELVSRGAALEGAGAVIIDESHRFREPTTRRYRVVAPALVGRPTILATATPVVNRIADLVAQLLLAVADDALRWSGVPSLRAIGAGPIPASLDPLIIRAPIPLQQVPSRVGRSVIVDPEPPYLAALRSIDRLACSRDAAVGGLIRMALARALGSSPAALLAALGRYRRLLDHAEQAARAGHRINRRAIQEVIDAAPDQLVLWELLDRRTDAIDLHLGDRRRVESLTTAVRKWHDQGDRKLVRLQSILADRRPTIVFAVAVETVRYLRQRLGMSGTAWVTGSDAGIGPLPASRHAVLGSFRSETIDGGPRPWLLIASDVAAEGLNLQGVSRVIHYDLPWTAVKLEQRDGRAIRLGSRHDEVEVVRFEHPLALERRLAVATAIARKASLTADLGLDRVVSPRFDVEPAPGWAVVAGARPAALAGFATASGGPLTLGRIGSGSWTTDPRLIDRLIQEASGSNPANRAIDLAGLLADLGAAVAHRVELAIRPLEVGSAAAVRALRRRGAELHRLRRTDEVARIGAAHEWASRGHSAGEALLAKAVAAGDPQAAHRAALLAETGRRPDPPRLTLVALVVFAPERD